MGTMVGGNSGNLMLLEEIEKTKIELDNLKIQLDQAKDQINELNSNFKTDAKIEMRSTIMENGQVYIIFGSESEGMVLNFDRVGINFRYKKNGQDQYVWRISPST